jgi:hypothetical protein
MLLQILALTNFLLGVYDAFLTQRRMKTFGVNFELNRLIKAIVHPLGPELASVVGILGPVVGWSYIFCYFNLPWALALMVGFNLKRFEMQLSSSVFERSAKQMQKMINEYRSANPATLPGGESTPQADRDISKEGK